MQLGMIGLGRMSANMVRRLINNGHQCVVYDRAQQTFVARKHEKSLEACCLIYHSLPLAN
jgi:6-phosphogluconate dehydrogenase